MSGSNTPADGGGSVRERTLGKTTPRPRKRRAVFPDTPARLRQRATAAVSRAVRLGWLPPVTTRVCVDCGAPATCYEHRDYREPLNVEPVCSRCNNLRGPGFPLRDAPRVAQHAIREKTGKTSGKNWSRVEGGSGAQMESAGGGTLGADDCDDLTAQSVNRRIGMIQAFYSGHRSARQVGDWWRSDYFKRHDPWFQSSDVFGIDPERISL